MKRWSTILVERGADSLRELVSLAKSDIENEKYFPDMELDALILRKLGEDIPAIEGNFTIGELVHDGVVAKSLGINAMELKMESAKSESEHQGLKRIQERLDFLVGKERISSGWRQTGTDQIREYRII